MAYNTANMGLRAWDEGDDLYSHGELATNFVTIDQHDHTAGKGVRLVTGSYTDRSVTRIKIALGAVGADEIEDGVIGSDKLTEGIVPLGIVDFWYRQSPTEDVPTGYEICDGRPWSTITNDLGYTTGNIPDLIDKFVLGAHPTATPAIGGTGGSNTVDLSHTHTVTSHTHGVPAHAHTVPAHSHGVNGHTHSIPSQAGLRFLDDGGNPQTLAQRGVPEGGGANRQFAYVPNLNSGNDPSKNADMTAHDHGGATGSATSATSSVGLTTNTDGATTSDPASPTTGGPAPSLAVVNVRPAWVGLLPIMRVRN
jgi:hypothetical protein